MGTAYAAGQRHERRPIATTSTAPAAVHTRTRSHARNSVGASAGTRDTARATCNWIPKSVATARIQPTVDPSEKIPKDSGDNRRAARIVTRKSEPFPARSANVLYAIRIASRSFALRNEFSSTVKKSHALRRLRVRN